MTPVSAARQTIRLGRHTGRAKSCIDRLETERYLKRLWDQDPGLWSSEAAAQAAIRKRLGWLTISGVMAREAEPLRRFAEEVRQAGFTHALLLGMGGSGLFAEVCRQTFGVAPGYLDLTVLDTTDPAAIRAQQQRCPLQRLCVIVSSKSGATSEVSALSTYFYRAFTSTDGNPGAHCLAITDAGTSLETQASAWKFRRVFAHGQGTGAEVGGRFSALTYFGLVPAALIGVDPAQLLRRADQMLARCGPEAPLDVNPAVQLGVAIGTLAQSGQDKMTIVCAPETASFGTWVEQLVAESLGKQGRGVVPIHGEPLREPSAYGPDRFFVELQLGSRIDRSLEARVRALAEAGHPVVRIRWQDPYDLGAEGVKWFIATSVAASVLGINPFDEPDVKDSKDRTKARLEQYIRDKEFHEEEPPIFSDGDAAVYGPPESGMPASLDRCLSDFFRQLRPGDFAALLSFLPRTPAIDQAAQALRERIGERLGPATMLQFGPRYLHSTGQLYKGGRDRGLFLLLTTDEREDLPIPGEAFTFGALKQAQALGDFDAMRQKGRRILRVHFRGDPERVLQRLAAAVA